MGNTVRPQSYIGDGEFAFVSFSEKDRTRAESFISAMQQLYRVRFDQGDNGSAQSGTILNFIAGCSVFLCIVTKAFFEDEKCARELKTILGTKKPVIFVLPDSTIRIPSGYEDLIAAHKVFKLDCVNTDDTAARELSGCCPALEQTLITPEQKKQMHTEEPVGASGAGTRTKTRINGKTMNRTANVISLIAGVLYVVASAIVMKTVVPDKTGFFARTFALSIPTIAFIVVLFVATCIASDDLLAPLASLLVAFFVSLILDMFFAPYKSAAAKIFLGIALKIIPGILAFFGMVLITPSTAEK